MTSLFTRWIPSITLAVWSTVLLGSYYSGRLTAFLHPAFRPGVMIAGFVLAALALFVGSRETPPECCSDASCTHPLSRSKGGRWITFLILVLPVTVAAWLSPEQFSRQAFEQRGIATDATGLGPRRVQPSGSTAAAPAQAGSEQSEPLVAVPPATAPKSGAEGPASAATSLATGSVATVPATAEANAAEPLPDYLQRTPEGYVIVEVLDLLYAVQDSQLRKDFEGRTVQLVAQMMPSKSATGPDNRFKAVRMFMTCCAADSRPVATMVEASPLPDFPEMTWVSIVGKATFPVENGKRTAVIISTSVQQTKPPEETMLF